MVAEHRRAQRDARPLEFRLPAVRGSGVPEVVIVLVSEPAHYDAERVFMRSVALYRDPARAYRVSIVRPEHSCSWLDVLPRQGRVICNTVGQVYLDDPGALSDLPLGTHAALAAPAPAAVLLADCAQLAAQVRHAGQRAADVSTLAGVARALPGGSGALPLSWCHRDRQFRPGRTRLLHFAEPRCQPWRPFPQAIAYDAHPYAEIFARLLRVADAEDLQLCAGRSPGPRLRPDGCPFTPPWARLEEIAPPARAGESRLVLHLDASPAVPPPGCTVMDIRRIDRQIALADCCVALALLEDAPVEEIAWLVDTVFAAARARAVFVIDLPARTGRDGDWYAERIARRAGRFANVDWQLRVLPEGRIVRAGGPAVRARSAWLLLGAKAGDNAQVRMLGTGLGVPAIERPLEFNPLHVLPNWLLPESLTSLRRATRAMLVASPPPDLVLSVGKRSYRAARWLKRRSRGRTRWIHLGRPWGRLRDIDLIVTTPQYRLPPLPNVLMLPEPISAIPPEVLARARATQPLASPAAERPRVALLVGGDSVIHKLTRTDCQRLLGQVQAHARTRGARIEIVSSRRTPARVLPLLEQTRGADCVLHAWSPVSRTDYLTVLARADELFVTADSASMIADALATGRPVTVLAVSLRVPARLVAALEKLIGRLVAGPGGDACGSPWAPLLKRAVTAGWFTPPREMQRLIGALVATGRIHVPGERAPTLQPRVHEPTPLEIATAAARQVASVTTRGQTGVVEGGPGSHDGSWRAS